MNIDYYNKYIKYKTKYLLFKNNIIPNDIIPNDENNISIGGGKKKVKLKTYLFADIEKVIEEEFTKLLDSKGWIRKDINKFPEYVDLFYSRNYKFYYNQLNNIKDYSKIYDIKSNIIQEK